MNEYTEQNNFKKREINYSTNEIQVKANLKKLNKRKKRNTFTKTKHDQTNRNELEINTYNSIREKRKLCTSTSTSQTKQINSNAGKEN